MFCIELFKFQTNALEMKLHIYTDACKKFFGDHEIVIQVTKFYQKHQWGYNSNGWS